jgi:hypothetical protein
LAAAPARQSGTNSIRQLQARSESRRAANQFHRTAGQWHLSIAVGGDKGRAERPALVFAPHLDNEVTFSLSPFAEKGEEWL